jgi:hypothetical protein
MAKKNATTDELSVYIEKALKDNDIKYEPVDSGFKMLFQSSPVDIDLLVQYNSEKNCIWIFAVSEYKVPLDKITSVLHVINKANLDNPGLSLRVDEEDGVISSAFLINTEGGIPDEETFQVSLFQCFYMVNENIQTILECVYGENHLDDTLLSQIKDGSYTC